MAFDIVTFGPLIVEIIRSGIGVEFHESGEFSGPFPSGDTPIFINAAARLGAKTALIGAVGGDEFGQCVTARLQESGVDMTFVQTNARQYTGSTFVTYYADGSRRFLYHLDGSGSTHFDANLFTKEYLRDCKWVHYTGFTMESAQSYADASYRSLDMLSPDTKVSFDPNIRPEIYTPEEIRKICAPILERADLILPSSSEAELFTGESDTETACRMLSDNGKKIVVLKCGSEGSKFFVGDEIITVPAFLSEEVDPTGAGDTYAAALLTALCEGRTLYDAGVFANAAGAFAVTKKGPMEGAATREMLDAFLASGSRDVSAFLHSTRF